MMTLITISMAFSVLIAWYVASWVLRRAKTFRLVQIPNHRSSHERPTPNGGGLGFVIAGSLVGVGLVLYFDWTLGGYVLGLGATLAAVGLRDDINHLSARVRFCVQIAVCSGTLLALSDMPNPSIISDLKFDLSSWILIGILLLTGVWWINLFNFMDGIDGLAGAQAVFMLLGGSFIVVTGNPSAITNPVWIWMLCIAAGTVGFLIVNWPPAHIFMGDVGSTWLGFMVFTLALFSVQIGWISYFCWLILAAVFVTDASSTLLTRMLSGERWYEAHRYHVYQKLARRWGSHKPVTLFASAINLLWLIPIAGACAAWPQFSFLWVLLAYAPLVIGTLMMGAGISEHA